MSQMHYVTITKVLNGVFSNSIIIVDQTGLTELTNYVYTKNSDGTGVFYSLVSSPYFTTALDYINADSN